MAAITIKFDPAGNPEMPTFVLATPWGRKLGMLNTATNFVIHDNLTSAAEFSLTVHKTMDGVTCPLWDRIQTLMLVWCREWDKWFQIDIDTEEGDETVKHLTATGLGEAELSQIYLYNIEINTESDILNDDYTVTVLYDSNNPDGSLLDRIMEKAPHYTIRHVDSTIDNIQRSFSFDGVTIYDAFQEIAEEIGCLFVLDNDSDDETDLPSRAISVYDLKTACMNDECEYYQEYGVRYRGSFTDVCPKCGSANILQGYGEDTTIFVSSDNLADTITKTPDTGSIKNCLRLVGGDDLMTAAIISCNPNGSQYIWYISDEMREMMSDELQEALAEYDDLYYECKYTREIEVSPDYIEAYNELVTKYHTYDDSIPSLPEVAIGFSGLMEAYYDTIDFNGYLQSELMPEVTISDTTAEEQIKLLEKASLSRVSLSSLTTGTSQATVESAIKLMVKATVDTTRYSYEISTTSWENGVADDDLSYWTGTVTLTSETDETDTATSSEMTITIDDDYENYIVQLIEKKNSGYDTDELSISALFALELTEFKAALKEYSLDYLSSIADCCQGVIDVLIDYGCGEAEHELYSTLYYPYYQKLKAINAEMDTRSDELEIIANVQDDIMAARDAIMAELDFEGNLGEELWQELCMFRREDVYENSNYISDGLTNDELFANAMQFLERAEDTLYQTAITQHSISTTLKNLLVIPEFQKIVDYFCVGNWIRVMIDDELYRLRLISYEIDYDDLSTLQVEFSDVEIVKGGSSDLTSLMSSMKSIATSYDSLTNQVESNSNSSAYVSGWVKEGLDITNVNLVNDTDDQVQTWDSHGLLLKKYNAVTDDYDSQQMKLVHRGLYITDDDWETVKTAVGNYYYNDPETGKLTSAYGVMAETLVGELILGEELGIYNDGGSLTFDEDGLLITNGTNTFAVNPNSDQLFVLSNGDGDILYVDADGNLNISAESITTTIADTVTSQIEDVTSTSVQSISTEFTISSSDTELDDDCEWSTETPTKTTAKPYIWMRSVYTYGNGDIVYGEPVCITGSIGVGISTVVEYYAISSSSTEAPTTWYTTIQTVSATEKYLWNYEEINYTDGTTTTTDPVVIGVYGDDGTGISDITEYYLATSEATDITTSTSGWTTDATSTNATVTATNKYLWNYEKVTYTDGTTSLTDPVIIGVYGDTGVGISEYVIYYYVTSGTTDSDGNISVDAPPDPSTSSTGWSTEQPDVGDDEYLWISYKITYTDGSVMWTDPTLLTDLSVRTAYTLISEKYNTVTETLDEYSRIIGDTDTLIDSDGNVVSIAEKLSSIEETAESITTTVSNIQEDLIYYVNRNYALLSGDYESGGETGWYLGSTTAANYYSISVEDGYTRILCDATVSSIYYVWIDLSDDFDSTVDCTVSFKIRVSYVAAQYLRGYYTTSSGSSSNVTLQSFSSSNFTEDEWVTLSYTFTPTSSYTYSRIGFSLQNVRTVGYYFDIAYIMVEQGDTVHDWEPAPEDGKCVTYYRTYNASQIAQLADSITLCVMADEETGYLRLGTGSDGTVKFTIDADNITLEESGDLTLTGAITCGKGSVVGGWDVSDEKIYGTSSDGSVVAVMQVSGVSDDTAYIFAAGPSEDGHSSYKTCPFRVNKDGGMWADEIAVANNVVADGYVHAGGAVVAGGALVANNGTDTGGIYCKNSGGTNIRVTWMSSSDNVGFGHSSYATYLWGTTITSNVAVSTSSDENLKTDIINLTDDYETLFDNLHPCSFRYTADKTKALHLGFTVQDTESAIEAAGLDPDDYAITSWNADPESGETYGALAYDEIIALLVKQVQTLKSRVAALENI